MADFAFIEEKLNYFFSDGVHRLAVFPKVDSEKNTHIPDVLNSGEKRKWESTENNFTTE